MKTQFMLSALAFVVACLNACVLANDWYTYFELPIRDVHQFPAPIYLQSISIGPTDGDLYMTIVWPDASIYHIKGANIDSPVADHIHKFESMNATTSIVATEPGVYAFLGGLHATLGNSIHGTYGVFELDVRGPDPTIEKIVHVPNCGLLAGVVVIPNKPNILLVSDSPGKVIRVDTKTRNYTTILKDPVMLPPSWPPLPFGINGISLHNNYLYFVHSFYTLVYRIKIDAEGYPAPNAQLELVIAVRELYLDSFAMGPGTDETIWIATNADNRVIAVQPDGNVYYVAGCPDQLTAAGERAERDAHAAGDEETLYVCAGGALLNPVNGTVTEGGKVVAINTTAFFVDRKPTTDFVNSAKFYNALMNEQRNPVNHGVAGLTGQQAKSMMRRI